MNNELSSQGSKAWLERLQMPQGILEPLTAPRVKLPYLEMSCYYQILDVHS